MLRGAGRDFGEGVGVFDIDLEVRPGTILGIVGPSGAGKTTTIRLITGALDPTEGEVRCWARTRGGSGGRPASASATCPSCSRCTPT